MWVGRTASVVFGLALVMALVVGAASTAWSATGGNFILGKGNVATDITRLAGEAGVDGPMLKLINNNADPNDTALGLRVQDGEAPMRVNSDTKVANLNADKVDGLSSEQLTGQTGPAEDSNLLDGKDSTAFLQAYAVSEDHRVVAYCYQGMGCYAEPISVQCDDADDYPLEAGRVTNLDPGNHGHEIEVESDPSGNLIFRFSVAGPAEGPAGDDDVTLEFLCFDADGDGATPATS
jgi:hypothetical protein